MNNAGANCIYGLSGTWLDTKVDPDLINPNKTNCLAFGCEFKGGWCIFKCSKET